jgi:acetoin utilization deacetylase AcuC-like enzyme
MYKPSIKTFYNHKQVMENNIEKSYSKSPLKPKLLLRYLKRLGLIEHFFDIHHTFRPFIKEDFLIAHTEKYVDAVFTGTKPLCSSNNLPWSKELVKSLCYTNASLYKALEFASQNPDQITFSPSAGFHHARPESGGGFCTFSGQVIASVKLYRKYGLKTAWLDLDGHFGNSIEDSREFVPDLNMAVPKGFNINPTGKHLDYKLSLSHHLDILERAILRNEINCVVWAHGADSHEDDDMGGVCSTNEWIACSRMFYTWVDEINAKRKKPLPVMLTLFGGYREDDYHSVLSLHTADLVYCLNTLCGHNIVYKPVIRQNPLRRGF